MTQGSAQRAIDQLNQEQREVETAKAISGTSAREDQILDPRFANKSREEILESYRHLESAHGRLANEVGQTRKTLDQLLLQKREQDISANAPPADIQPADLLQRPQEVLERLVDAKIAERLAPVAAKTQEIESKLLDSEFATRHSDSAEIANSPEFKTWVSRSQLRKELAGSAAQGNTRAADALLTEYKDFTSAVAPSGEKTHLEAALEKAGKISLEGTRTGGSDSSTRASGVRYKREDLMRLRVQNPEEYERMGAKIYQAYQEGRVD
jgi:hypothetical protein